MKKVIEMIRLMGFLVVCEGIEEPAQAMFCKKIGCDIAQGYLYGKPMPMNDFEKLLSSSTEV